MNKQNLFRNDSMVPDQLNVLLRWTAIIRTVAGLFILLSLPLPLLAVTHDDSESMIPEFYISFRGTGTGTPRLTVNFDAYQLPNGSGGLTNYTESAVTNGFANGVTWTNMSLYVNKGMPLDQVGTLRITSQNIAEYKVFINTPDTKYQPYVGQTEEHLIYWTNALSITALSITNNVLFKHAGDNGAEAGKASSAMPGWRNFKLALGYGKNGKSLGYVTFLYGNQPVLSDTSQEIVMSSYVDASSGISHGQLYSPRMVFDFVWNASYVESGFLNGAYIINCYDKASQPGTPTVNLGVSYLDYSGYTPVVSYILNYAGSTSSSTTKIKRQEGGMIMDASASYSSYTHRPIYLQLCSPGYTIPGGCTYDGYCWPGFTVDPICTPELISPPSGGATTISYDWATAGLPGNRNFKTSTDAITFNLKSPPVPVSELISSTVGLGSRIDSSRTESSTTFKTLSSGNLFWTNLTILHDGASGYLLGSAIYNWQPGTGRHLKLMNQIEPGGNWSYYEYYDDIDERGMLKRVTKPYGTGPITPAANVAGALVTEFTYTNDWDNSKTLPAEIITRLKGASSSADKIISRIKYDYSASFTNIGQPALYQGTLPIWVTEQHDYYGPGATDYTTTISKRFRPDGPRIFANLPVSLQHPDGTKDLWNYECGTYDPNGRSFTVLSGNPVQLLYTYSSYVNASTRIWKMSCFPATAPGAETSVIDGDSYVVPNKSTAEVQIRDQYGRLAMIETLIYTGSGSWSRLEATSHNYDAAGNLIASYRLMDGDGSNSWMPIYEAEYTDINGANTSYSSINFANSGNPTGRKQYERDRGGRISKFSYDDYGRVTSVRTLQAQGSSNPSLQSFYSYDADNRVLSSKIGTSAVDPNALVTSNMFNLAGLPVKEAAPGGYITTNDYSKIASRIVTQTILGRNNSAFDRTVVTTKNLDGTILSVSGTSVIPRFYSYSIVNVNGIVTLPDGSTPLAGTARTVISQGTAGPTLTSRTNVTDMDWLGHTVRQESGNPTTPGNLVTTYTYNNQGQLFKTVTGNLAPVLNQYDSFGQLFRSGIKLADSSGSTNLNPASMDRISEQTTSFYLLSGVWWEATVNSTYPKDNDATPLVVKQTLVQRSGFQTINSIPNNSSLILDSLTEVVDASGNLTTTGTLCDRNSAFVYTEQDSNLTGGSSYLTGGKKAVGWSSKTVAVNGQKTYQLNGNGTGEDVLTYDAYGRMSSDKKYVAGNPIPQTTTLTYRPNSTELVWQQNADNTCLSNVYNPAGQIATNIVYTNTTAIGGKLSCYSYNLRGQPTAMWGDIPRPATNIYYTSTIGADYNAALEGELYDQWTFNTGTWTAWPSTLPAANITRYLYYPQNGLLLSKTARDASGNTNSVRYTYNPRGDLLTRTWNRGVVTTYGYNETSGANSGELATVQYSNDPSGNDPALAYTYNRLGALSGVTDACGTRSFVYRTSDQQLDHQNLPSSIYGSGLLLGLNYDGFGRLSGYWLGASSSTASVSAGYQYYDSGPTDFSGRLSTVTTSLGAFSYSYLSGTPQISTVTGPALGSSGTFNRLDQYAGDTGLLTNSVTGLGANPLAGYNCLYDGFHRLKSFGQTGRIYSHYGSGLAQGLVYNDRNELTNSTTFLTNLPATIASATPLPRRKFAFKYDNDGNRTNTAVDADPALNYAVNFLEQYSSRARPQFVEVSGVANSNTVITAMLSNVVFTLTHLGIGVNSNYYYYGQSTRTGTNAGGETLTLSNVLSISGVPVVTNKESRGMLAPPTNQVFTYDKDGNLTNDALWVYSYDDEDRIKQIQSAPAMLTVTNVLPVRLNFTYDFLGRRAQKQVWNYVGGTWVLNNTIIFAYDGLNLIAEYHLSGSTLVLDKSYYWGLDKSGSLQGAGGIGGFLGMVTHSTPTVGKYAAINDPWGNVVGLFDLNMGIPVAEYEYTPFGEPLRAMGVMATNNPWRFSTKYYDRETGLLNFGCRYYSPSVGRFVNRDPKDELGRLQMNAPFQGGNIAIWSYIGQLVGVPGRSPGLTPNTAAGLAQSNERQDRGYRDSAEPGNIFVHRKGNPSQGGGSSGSFSSGGASMAGVNHPYGFVNNNPYGTIDPTGLFWSELFGGIYSGFAGSMDTIEQAVIFPFVGLELSASFGSFSAGFSAAASDFENSGLGAFGNAYDVFQNADSFGGLELFGVQLPLIGNFLPGPQGDQAGDVMATVTSRGVHGTTEDSVESRDNRDAQRLGINDNISAPYVGGSIFQVITELFLGNTGPGLNYASQVSGQLDNGTIDQLDHSGGVIRSLIGSKFLGAYGIGVSENFSSQGPALGFFNNVANMDWKLSPGYKEPTSTISWILSPGLLGTTPDVGWNNGLHIQPGEYSVWDASAGQALRH